MKNLKKIIVALIVLAALVTALVITALASDGEAVSYTGTVAEANEMLAAIEGVETDAEKSTELQSIWTYLATVNPDSDGYEELMNAYSDKTLAVGIALLEATKEYKGEPIDKAPSLRLVYLHITKAPLYEEHEEYEGKFALLKANYSDEALKVSVYCLDYYKELETYEDRLEFFSATLAYYVKKFLPVVDDTVTGYDDDKGTGFIDEFNECSLALLNEALTKTPDTALGIQNLNNTYSSIGPMAKYSESEYYSRFAKFKNAFDAKLVGVLELLLSEVDATSEDYSLETTDLVAVYNLVKKVSPFDKEGEGYVLFTENLNERAYALALRYYENIDKMMNAEAGDAEFSKAVSNFVGFLKDCPVLLYRAPELSSEYTGSVVEAKELLAAVELCTEEALDGFAALYAYLLANAPDPSSEGAEKFYAEYESVKAQLAERVILMINELDSECKVDGVADEAVFTAEFAKLKEIYTFLEKTPISLNAINEYNEKAAEFMATAKELYCPELVFAAPELSAYTGKVSEAKLLLDAVDVKAANALEAYAALYSYMTKTPVDPAANGAAELYASYEKLTGEVAALVLSSLNELTAVPTYSALFNKFAHTVTYKTYEIKTLDGTVEEASALLDAVNALIDEGNTLAEIMNAYKALYKYNYETAVKPELAGAADYYDAYAALTAKVSKLVVDTVAALNSAPKLDDGKTDTEALIASAELLASIADFLEKAPVSKDAVDKYNAVLPAFKASIEASCGADFDRERFSLDLAKLTSLQKYLKATPVSAAVIDAYNATAEAFANGYKLLNSPDAVYKPFVTAKLEGELDKAIALLDTVSAKESEALEAFAELFSYMKNNAVNPEEEGAKELYLAYEKLTAKALDYVMALIEDLDSAPLTFDAVCPELVYNGEKTESLMYGGTLTKANELLTAFRYALGATDAKLTGATAAYTALYDYLYVNGINPATEGYSEFLNIYGAAKAELSAKLVEALDTELSDEDFVAYAKFLAKTHISREAIEKYNAVRPTYRAKAAEVDKEAFYKELQNIKNVAAFLIDNPMSLEAVSKYNETVNGFTATLKQEFDSVYVDFVEFKTALEAYLKSCSIKPELLPEDVDYEGFKAVVDSLSKYEIVKGVADKLYTLELGKDGVKLESVDEYRAAFAEAINNMLSAELLTFEEMGTPESYTGSLSTAQTYLNACLEAADAEEKAELYKALNKYVTENPLNPKLDGYELFNDSYEELGEQIYRYLLSKVDAEKEIEGKIAELANMREYLEEAPISKYAANAYNTKYKFVYKDSLEKNLSKYSAVMETLHAYLDKDVVKAVVGEIEGLEALIDNYETLEIMALVQLYELIGLDDAAGTVSVTDRGVAVKQIINYERNYTINEGSYAYTETMGDVNASLSSYYASIEEAKQALDAAAPLEEYDLNGYNFVCDFNDSNPKTMTATHFDNESGLKTGSRYDFIDDTVRGGKYFKWTVGTQGDGGKTPDQQYLNVSQIKSQGGIVMEFDLTGDEGVSFINFKRLDRTSGSAVQREMFRIQNNKFYKSVDGVVDAEAWDGGKQIIYPGEWTHFIFVYDPVNVTITGYIDYECIGTWSMLSATPTDEFVEIRIQTGTLGSSLNLDNFNIYEGTSFRIKDKFSDMTDADKFTYFVDYMSDETKSPTSRLQAYQKANSLLELVAADESLADYIEKFGALDVESDIINPAKDANLDVLKAYALELDAFTSVTTENSAQVKAVISKIESFISDNSAYIAKASEDYNKIVAKLSEYDEYLQRCETLISFINELKRFDRASTLAAKTKHYEAAVQYYDLGAFYEEDVMRAVMLDPAVVEFEALINPGLLSDDEAYMTAFEYYFNCIKLIDVQKLSENSKRIIDCVGFVVEMDGYADTEEFWSDNFDYINKYMNIIRDIVRTENYDPTYEGVEAAIARFREIDVYFYDVLQAEHVKLLTEQLAKYPASSSYIEKLGICTFVTKYIEANDIDTSRPELSALVIKNATYLEELEIYMDEYQKMLDQNTVSFVNTVKEMDAYVSYTELTALYNEALTYYYEMNLTDDAKLAVEKFEAYSAKLAEMENDAAMFEGYVRKLNSAKNDSALYKALVNCLPYVDKVSSDVPGVSDMLETYNEKLAEYNAKIDGVNAEIAEINGVVSSVRTNVIAEAVISVINKLFNN